MRVVDVSNPGKITRVTALSYGQSRAGKTRFAGSWPRPLFLADATESGWTTLSNADHTSRFEPSRPPVVWAIETAGDMMKAIKDAEPLIKRGDIRTVCIDSLTFYADLFFNAMDSLNSGRVDQRQLYLKLGQHLKDLRISVHQLGCNVVWLALEKPPGEDNPVGSPMLSGQNAQKFAAGCDYVFYHRSFQAQPNAPIQWEIRTKKFQAYQAGGRDEGLLPDPLGYYAVDEAGSEIFKSDCTYRTMAEALGILTADGGIEQLPLPEARIIPPPEPVVAPPAVAAATVSDQNGKRPTAPAQQQQNKPPQQNPTRR